jgi:hypothetical protein
MVLIDCVSTSRELTSQDLQNAVKTALERAVRENDLIYVSPVPTATQLDPINGAGMVKLATPAEIAEPVEWLMKGGAGIGPLFSGLVPYGVHLALSEFLDVLLLCDTMNLTEQVFTMIGKTR